MNPEQKRKEKIRARDRKRYPKTGRCFLCGTYITTTIHHRYYSDRYNPDAIIEVCRRCHDVLDGIRSYDEAEYNNHNLLKSVGENINGNPDKIDVCRHCLMRDRCTHEF